MKLYLTAASKPFLYCGSVGGDVVKHNVLPKAQTLRECTHRLQGSFFYSLFISFFKRTIQKKTENTGVLCALMLWSSSMSLSLCLQTSSGSDFLRQFVSGNWSFQLQLSVSWELLGKKRGCSSFSKCWWIQHNEHVTDHKDRQIRFFLSLGTVFCDTGEKGAKHGASQQYRCDAKEAFSSTLLFTCCSCWDSYRLYKFFFFRQKSLNWISALSAYCKLQARTAKHSVL